MSAASLSPSSCLDDLLYLLGDQDGWAVQKAKFMSLLAALSWTDEAAENMWAEWVGFCGVEVEEGKKAAHVTSLSRAQLVEMYSLSEYEREGDEFALLMLVREMFKAFDVRGQGVFTAQDMADAFERGNLDFVPGGTKDMDAEFAAAVFAAVDLDGNGELDFDEFAAAVLKWDTSAFMQMKGISTPDSEVKNKTNQEKTYIAHNLDQSSLEHSLDRVMKCWEDPDELLRFSRHWLGNLFKSHPETIPLFNANLNANVKPVFLLLQQIVYSLESFEEWIPRLQRLGVKHIEMGVTQEHFHSLLTSFFKAMPVDISQEEKKQWTTLFDLIYYTMMTASERKDLLNDPNLAVGRMVEYGQDQPYLNPEVTTGEAFADYVLRAGLHHPASTHEYLKRFGRGTSFMHPRRACLDFVTEYRKYSRSFLELSKKITSQMACPELRDMVESDQKEEEGLVDPEASLKLQAKGYSVASFDGIPHTELFENLVKLVTERATGGDDTKKEGGERGGGQEEGPGDVFTKTMTEIAESSPHQALGAFAYGAELLVPVIYPLIYSGLKQVFGDEQAFVFFPLHTICDDEHGTTLLNVVVKLTGNDKEAREAVFRGAKLALRARSVMWDGLLARANKMPVDPESNSPSAVSPPLPRPPVGGGCPFAITEALGEAKAEAEKGKSSAPCAAMGKGGGDGSGCPLAPAVSVKEGKGIGGVDEKDGAGGGGAQGLFSEATAGKSVSELYDEQSNAWARREPSCLSDFTGRPALFNMCKPFIQGASVLDVGCGEGYCARILSEMGAKDIIGIDISSDMIEKAKAAEEASPLGNIKYVAGDSRSLVQTLQREAGLLGRQFQTIEESFDVIVAVFLFNYMTIEDMKQVGHDVQRLLKDGGHFIFSVPHPCSPWWQREHVPPFHWKRPTEQQNYFNAMDQCLEGKIYRTDGGSLNVRNFHKHKDRSSIDLSGTN